MRATLFALLAVVAACKKADPPPACPQVVDHMLEVMKTGLTGHGNLELGNRKQMIDQCEQRKLSATERRCMLAAKDLPALASCRAQPTPAPTAPAGPIIAPAGSGS